METQRWATFSMIGGLVWLVSLGLVGYLAYQAGHQQSPQACGGAESANVVLSEVREPSNFSLINPLLECETNISTNVAVFTQLEKDINTYIDEQKKNRKVTQVAVYFRDLNNGPWFGINQDLLFSPASLIKVPLLITYFRLAETNPDVMTQKITFTGEQGETIRNLSPNILPEENLQIGEAYEVRELLRRMIVYSDNLAYDLLIRNIDPNLLEEVYQDLRIDLSKTAIDPGGNTISVRDIASFFRVLYNASYLTRSNSEKALQLLSESRFKDGLLAPIPAEIITAHKFGERTFIETGEKQLHECGIFYLPNKPYILCVMTRGYSFEELENVIKGISQTAFEQRSR